MGNKTQIKIEHVFAVILLVVTLFLLIVVLDKFGAKLNEHCCQCGDYNNKCCPCINREHYEEVVEWHGYKASSAGSWEYMCRTYKEANNKTFECFE